MIIKKLTNPFRNLQPIDKSDVSTLYILSEKSLATAIVFAIFITVFLYEEINYSIITWCITVIFISLIRLYYAYLFKHQFEIYTLESWYSKFTSLAFLTGIIVSSLSFVFIPYLNDYHQIFVLAALLGLTAGASVSLSSDFRIALTYISTIMIPLIISIGLYHTSHNLVLSVLLILFFISQVMMLHKNYDQDKKIRHLQVHNQTLLRENKQFIADMVHQIRTPLTVIMTNTSLIEMKSESSLAPYTNQIHSAINTLSNSYEDLSYIISNDVIIYQPIDLNISQFLKERVAFFEVIASANRKTLHTNIKDNIRLWINDTELERVIDNNISNAIKHSHDESHIDINIEQKETRIILQFISKGKNIHNTVKIFEKDYSESDHNKRSLGLGLNMVKYICEKNNIEYFVRSKDNINTFTYIFHTTIG